MFLIIAWIALAVLALGTAASVACLLRKPMHELLGANSYVAPAQRFYVRAFALVVSLGALAAIVGKDLPCSDQRKEMTGMEYVWWVVGGLENAFWSIGIFLLVYVLLLTILFAALGRYRDE